MKAYVLERYGGPSAARLKTVPDPLPGPGDVLVQVQAAGLNPVDYKFRRGMLRPIYNPTLPVVMGSEFAGTVVQCGTGVTAFQPGDRVFACSGFNGSGAWGEYIAVASDLLARMPENLDFTDAAGIPLAGLTALQVLRDELRLQSGQTVLITGGAGGVGTLAIQLAVSLDAHVVTTASPRGNELVRRLGAHEVIDYTQQPLHQLNREFDLAFDLVGGDTLKNLFRVVSSGGRIVSIAGVPEPRTARDLHGGAGLTALFWAISLPLRWRAWKRGVDYRYFFMTPSGKDLSELAHMLSNGSLHPVVDRVFPFEETAEAVAYLEEGHAKGKVVVRMAPEDTRAQ